MLRGSLPCPQLVRSLPPIRPAVCVPCPSPPGHVRSLPTATRPCAIPTASQPRRVRSPPPPRLAMCDPCRPSTLPCAFPPPFRPAVCVPCPSPPGHVRGGGRDRPFHTFANLCVTQKIKCQHDLIYAIFCAASFGRIDSPPIMAIFMALYPSSCVTLKGVSAMQQAMKSASSFL